MPTWYFMALSPGRWGLYSVASLWSSVCAQVLVASTLIWFSGPSLLRNNKGYLLVPRCPGSSFWASSMISPCSMFCSWPGRSHLCPHLCLFSAPWWHVPVWVWQGHRLMSFSKARWSISLHHIRTLLPCRSRYTWSCHHGPWGHLQATFPHRVLVGAPGDDD